MDLPEEQTCSFVIRFWLEGAAAGVDQVVWRGQFTQVASGERHSLKELANF